MESTEYFSKFILEKCPCLLEKARANKIKFVRSWSKRMAAILLHGAGKVQYEGSKNMLAQNVAMNINHYPRSMEKEVNVLNTYGQINNAKI